MKTAINRYLKSLQTADFQVRITLKMCFAELMEFLPVNIGTALPKNTPQNSSRRTIDPALFRCFIKPVINFEYYYRSCSAVGADISVVFRRVAFRPSRKHPTRLADSCRRKLQGSLRQTKLTTDFRAALPICIRPYATIASPSSAVRTASPFRPLPACARTKPTCRCMSAFLPRPTRR